MKGIVLGLLIAGLVLACNTRHPAGPPPWQVRMEKMQEINTLWAQIRDWRAEAKWELEPPRSIMISIQGKTVRDVQKVCPENHKVPKACDDTCRLSGSICENAELICKIADSLGKEDRAQEKCTSAKASCREAKQKCCSCSTKPVDVEPPATPTEPTK